MASICRRPTVATKLPTWTIVKAVNITPFGDYARPGVDLPPAPLAAAAATEPAPIITTFVPPIATPTERAQEADTLIRAVYAHMFGQAYLFAADRTCLAPAESAFRVGLLSVKDLVRAVAKSRAYTTRFLEKQTTYANVEVLTSHLLGRRPAGVDDYRRWARVYDAAGYGAMVDAMMGDGEYDDAFGDAVVPHERVFGLPVSEAEAYRRAVTPAGIRLDRAVEEEDDAGTLAVGLGIMVLLVVVVAGLAVAARGIP